MHNFSEILEIMSYKLAVVLGQSHDYTGNKKSKVTKLLCIYLFLLINEND